ncbi:MAG: DNA-entry nuclease, partial [Ruminococcus sp.]|nr:DNA-entry nuclease [Ruminococcus sp.]
PVPETPPEPVQPVVTESNYVLNTSTMKAHTPNCRDVDKIAPENRQDYYGTVEDVQAMGYDSCGHCNPW